MRIAPRPPPRERGFGHIGGDNLGALRPPGLLAFGEMHRQRKRLLPIGAAGRPDAHAPPQRHRIEAVDRAGDHLEYGGVAVEEAFLIEQCVHHLVAEIGIAPVENLADQRIERRDVAFAHQRLECRFDAPFAVRRDLLAGPRFE